MIDHVGIYGSRVAEGLSAFNVGLVYIVFGSVCTSSKQNSHIFRHVNNTLTSITLVSQITVTQLDCLFNRLLRQTSTPAFLALCEGNPSVTNGFPSQKASNAASVGPMLVQRWHTTIGITLAQR